MKDQTYFSKDWLEDPDFKNWFVSCTNNTQARCKLCQKTFNLSNMGRQALVSHASGKKNTNFMTAECKCFSNQLRLNKHLPV